MRKTPGTTNKPASDVVIDVPAGMVLTVTAGPTNADQMRWWLNSGTVGAANVTGWQAEALPDGTKLLAKYEPPTLPPGIILPPTFEKGDRFKTTTIVRLRQTPGATNKPPSDVIQETPAGAEGKIVEGPQRVEDLTWWRVNVPSQGGQMVTGWMAEALADGTTLMAKLSDGGKTIFEPGDLAVVSDFANIRQTPGTTNKPADDVIGMFSPEAVVTILDGPQVKDDITWWRVGGITSTGTEGPRPRGAGGAGQGSPAGPCRKTAWHGHPEPGTQCLSCRAI
ncbi:MAG: hypothetical protein IPK16_01210 [Anaerolineales bacterium]|nr:hypothetical protein [Anaerolineales bacterium]